MSTTHHNLVIRLNRIEGQIAALKRSLSTEDIDCAGTLTQVKAATNGLKSFAEALAHDSAKRCLSEKKGPARLAKELDIIINSAFHLS